MSKTKKEIVAKLLEDKAITFDDALTLMEKEVEYRYWSYPYWYQTSSPTITWGTGTNNFPNYSNQINN